MSQIPEIITYEQVKLAMLHPPPEELVNLFNEISLAINEHALCISEEQPFNKLCKPNSFCISATSIQSDYIAFVLGKHISSRFPDEIIQQFFDIDVHYKVQFGLIKGRQIDGCICLIHSGKKEYDLKQVYMHIYS